MLFTNEPSVAPTHLSGLAVNGSLALANLFPFWLIANWQMPG